MPQLGEALLRNEFAPFDAGLDVVEGTVAVLDLLVQLGELPGERFALLLGRVEGTQLLEGVTEGLEVALKLTRVELERALHDAAVVQVGDIDDVLLLGALGR